MNKILWILLFLLMIYIDRERGIKLFVSIFMNFLILLVLFYFIALGFHPIISSAFSCILIALIILYFVNGKNIKTESAMNSVIWVIIILTIGIIIMTSLSRIAGFGEEAYEEINMFSYDVKIDFTNISISLILISLIGVTIDTAIAISSALYEVYENNKNLSQKEYFKSGMNIGKDILCTSMNTLLFAFLGDFMTLVIWFYQGKYTFLEIMNSKTFAAEFIKILFSGTGCILIIPISSYITSKKIIKLKKDYQNDNTNIEKE